MKLCQLLLGFFIVYSSQLNSKDISDKDFMDKLEKKLQDRQRYIKILREKGPEAYLKARGLKLAPEEKKLFVSDLVKIMEQKDAPRAILDRKRKVLIVKDEQGKSESDIGLLKKGFIIGKGGEKVFIHDLKYSELKGKL